MCADGDVAAGRPDPVQLVQLQLELDQALADEVLGSGFDALQLLSQLSASINRERRRA